MRNVLFVGPYNSLGGWAEAARAYIQALSTIKDINLSIRPIYMCGTKREETSPLLLELESKTFEPDIVIQNVLPHFLDYRGEFRKNIALIHTETIGWMNPWKERLALIDEIWVPSAASQNAIKDFAENTYLVPVPGDLEKVAKSYKPLNIPEIENTFNFYFIGEMIHRKGLDVLLRAFHLTFDPQEPVNLVIKTHKFGHSDKEVGDAVDKLSYTIKNQLRLYPRIEDYKQEVVIAEYVTSDALCALHRMCHCFIMPSRGESYSIPALDACIFGNELISSKFIGTADFTDNLIDGMYECVQTDEHPLNDLYTGYEMWFEPNILSLSYLMRTAYNNHLKGISTENRKIQNHSIEAVARKMEKLLND